MLWLFIALGSYILLAVASLVDKILLGGAISNPKLYAFYVGILSSAALLFLPFGIWTNPAPLVMFTGMAAGMAQIYGSYFYFTALKHHEVSRTVPMIGGLVPIFGFILTVAVSGGMAVLGFKELIGFLMLVIGSWMMMAKGFSIKKNGWSVILLSSFLYALAIVLAKLVYLQLPPQCVAAPRAFLGVNFSSCFIFLRGFLLLSLGSVTAALTFLFSDKVRKTVFGHHSIEKSARPNPLFFAGQIMGGTGILLQNFAVSLAPQASVPVINAMAGIQYACLFFFSVVLSWRYPLLLKEKMTATVIFQKFAAIALIIIGLAIFTLS